MNTLIDSVPKQGVLLSSPQNGAIERVQQLTHDLFGNTRQQYQQSLNESYDITAEQAVELTHRRNLGLAAISLGLATAGVLLSPIFYLPSIGCILYSTKTLIVDAYHLVVKERTVDYRIMWALTIPIALAGGFVWAAAFGALTGRINLYLVAKTENRSKQNIASLFGGQIRTAWLLMDGIEVETSVEQIREGDIVVVQAGQTVPVDGVVDTGIATVDQHMLTGEAQPVEKERGDNVLASTIVLSGRVCIRVEKTGHMTVASQITDMLNQTTDFKQALKSRTERWLNQMLGPLTALSLLALPLAGMSGAVAVLWYYPGFRMVLYGPLSMLSFLQLAAQKGILVKDGRALEALHEIDTVVFDKTGTLTQEQPTVSRILCCNGYTQADILRYAASAETKQSHPIAHAIVQAATEQKLTLPRLEDAEYVVGYGLKTRIQNRVARIGSVRFMAMEGFEIPLEIAEEQLKGQAQGRSMVLVALDNEIAGAIELMPTLRPEADAIIDDLHKRGIKTVIISGDHETPTRHLAKTLGIDQYFAEVLPEDKAHLVRQLQDEGRKVCFIGDGINDSIALKTADVSISLRGATTVATDMAQIVFMNGNLSQLPALFTLADEFAANMRMNFLAAVVPGFVGIAGTLVFGWGVMLSVLLSQASTPFGLYNALKPLISEQRADTGG
ncbi:MAG: heavy metal translocating P-type ATPase [Chloroflexota bacterium]